jgi:hypothetical protein
MDFDPEFNPPLNVDERELAKRVAKHEAGHYIAGRVLGFRMNGLEVKLHARGGYSGGAEIHLCEDLSGDASMLDYLERRVKVLYAGALAEALIAGNGGIDYDKAVQYSKDGSFGDAVKVAELLNLIRNIRFGLEPTDATYNEQLAAINAEMWGKAASLVTANYELIEGLADRLAALVLTVGVTFGLDKGTINAMPAIKKRFLLDPTDL